MATITELLESHIHYISINKIIRCLYQCLVSVQLVCKQIKPHIVRILQFTNYTVQCCDVTQLLGEDSVAIIQLLIVLCAVMAAFTELLLVATAIVLVGAQDIDGQDCYWQLAAFKHLHDGQRLCRCVLTNTKWLCNLTLNVL